MAEKIDLTGRKFGRLTVLYESAVPYISPQGVKSRRWVCRCDCGTETTVLQSCLTTTNHGTRSCGCVRRGQLMKDRTGEVYGRLTVIEKALLPKPDKNGALTGWRCRCECGNEIIVRPRELDCGRMLSCGCLHSEVARDKIVNKNYVGHFGGTTVTAIMPNRKTNSNNSSGVTGVYWSEPEQCWIAKIGFRRKTITIGRFKTIEDAIAARKAAEKQYFDPIIEEYEQFKQEKQKEDS